MQSLLSLRHLFRLKDVTGNCAVTYRYKKKKYGKMGKELFSLSQSFRGSLILSDACFQHRASMTLSFPLFFSSAFKLFFSRGFSSRRIPSKNKRVPPAWFLQSREESAREKGTFVGRRRCRCSFNTRDATV